MQITDAWGLDIHAQTYKVGGARWESVDGVTDRIAEVDKLTHLLLSLQLF